MSFFINCKEATHLSSLKEARQLNFKQKFKYYVHVNLCPPCKRFEKQLQKIRTSILEFKNKLEENPPHRMSESKKDNIQNSINNHLNK